MDIKKANVKFNKILINYSNRKKSSWTLFLLESPGELKKKNPDMQIVANRLHQGHF